MSLEAGVFRKKKVLFENLLAFGFVASSSGYDYEAPILAGDFQVQLHVDAAGQLSGQVVDTDLGEVYTAIHVSGRVGNFVGQVREAYLELLEEVATACYVPLDFSSDQMNRMAHQISQHWGDGIDYPFEKHPQYASYRIAGKWYALVFPLKLAKLGFTGEQADQEVEVVNLKVDPKEMERLLAIEGIYPSYHMSKKSWVSVLLDGSLSDDQLWNLLAQSRRLANPNPLGNENGPDYWVIPANPKFFDIDAEFAENKIVHWTQKGSIKKGDLVCMYVTAPVQAIRYLCRCLEAQIENNLYPELPQAKKLMKVELIASFKDDLFPFERMKELGIGAVRGPRRLTQQMISAVDKEWTGQEKARR